MSFDISTQAVPVPTGSPQLDVNLDLAFKPQYLSEKLNFSYSDLAQPGAHIQSKLDDAIEIMVEVDPAQVRAVNLVLFDDSSDPYPIAEPIKMKPYGSGQRYCITVTGANSGLRYAFQPIPWNDHGYYIPWAPDPYALALIPARWLKNRDCSRDYAPRLARYPNDPDADVKSAISVVVPPLEPLKHPAQFKKQLHPTTGRLEHDLGGELLLEIHLNEIKCWFPDERIPDAEATFRGKQGTIFFLRCPSFRRWVQQCGYSTLILMPLQAKLDERHLTWQNKHNEWGYCPISMLALDARHFHAQDPQEQLLELRETMNELHFPKLASDLKPLRVLLDFVGGHVTDKYPDPSRTHQAAAGPPLGLASFADRKYFMVNPDGAYVNASGCGQTINPDSELVRKLLLTSLGHLYHRCGFDGFRFDQGSLFGRHGHSELKFDPEHPLLKSIIAGPWLSLLEPGDDCGMPVAHGPWLELNFEFRNWWMNFFAGAPHFSTMEGAAHRTSNERPPSILLTGRDTSKIFSNHQHLYQYFNRHLGVEFANCHDGPTVLGYILTGWRNDDGSLRVPGILKQLHTRGLLNFDPDVDPGQSLTTAFNILRGVYLAMLATPGPKLRSGPVFKTRPSNDNPYDDPRDLDWDHVSTLGRDHPLVKMEIAAEDFVCAAQRLRAQLGIFNTTKFYPIGNDRRGGGLIWYNSNGTPIEWRHVTRRPKRLFERVPNHKLAETWQALDRFTGVLYEGREAGTAPIFVAVSGIPRLGKSAISLPAINSKAGWAWHLIADSNSGHVLDPLRTERYTNSIDDTNLNKRNLNRFMHLEHPEAERTIFHSGRTFEFKCPGTAIFRLIRIPQEDHTHSRWSRAFMQVRNDSSRTLGDAITIAWAANNTNAR